MLDKIQQEIVDSNAKRIVVLAGAGSGKTKVLTERVRRLIKEGVDQKKIVAITFTNQAAEEMRERLEGIIGEAFIGTIHAYANKLLLLGGYSTTQFIKEEKFDKFFSEIKKHPEVIVPVEHLLVDEYQDIDYMQHTFFKMINPENFFVVGDDWQAIYQFRDASSEFIKDCARDSNFTKYFMGNNYRSGRNIVNFAMTWLRPISDKIKKTISPQVEDDGQVIEKGPDLKFLLNQVKTVDDFKDWFILAYSNANVDMILGECVKMGIPCDTFKKSEMSNKDLKNRMKQNTVKVLTVHSAKGLEATNVGVYGVTPSNENARYVCYVAATRAKKLLIWLYGKEPRRLYK